MDSIHTVTKKVVGVFVRFRAPFHPASYLQSWCTAGERAKGRGRYKTFFWETMIKLAGATNPGSAGQ
jgi:hypothetical protein